MLRYVLLALALTLLPVAAGVVWADGGEDEPEAPQPPTYESTPLASYDTASVTVARAGFCERIPEEAVVEALGGEPSDAASYGTGERAAVTGSTEDVAHEYGCRYQGADGAEARAWVFAPPVTIERARDLVEEASGIGGCRPQQQAEEYGAPSLALLCPARGRRFASYRGLFGDAWLACSVAVPGSPSDPEALDRAGRWCVAVAEAAALS